MKCPNRGAENPYNANYCGKCEVQLRESRSSIGEANDKKRTAMRGKSFSNANEGPQDDPDDSLPWQFPWRAVNWTPLLMVIASVYLASLGRYGFVVYPSGYGFSWQTKVSVVLSFLATIAFLATVALVVYRREDLGKQSLVAGLVLLVLLFIFQATTYF